MTFNSGNDEIGMLPCWVHLNSNIPEGIYVCVKCAKMFEGWRFKEIPNYCPSCGLKMFGKVQGRITVRGEIVARLSDFKIAPVGTEESEA